MYCQGLIECRKSGIDQSGDTTPALRIIIDDLMRAIYDRCVTILLRSAEGGS